ERRAEFADERRQAEQHPLARRRRERAHDPMQLRQEVDAGALSLLLHHEAEAGDGLRDAERIVLEKRDRDLGMLEEVIEVLADERGDAFDVALGEKVRERLGEELLQLLLSALELAFLRGDVVRDLLDGEMRDASPDDETQDAAAIEDGVHRKR